MPYHIYLQNYLHKLTFLYNAQTSTYSLQRPGDVVRLEAAKPQASNLGSAATLLDAAGVRLNTKYSKGTSSHQIIVTWWKKWEQLNKHLSWSSPTSWWCWFDDDSIFLEVMPALFLMLEVVETKCLVPCRIVSKWFTNTTDSILGALHKSLL